MQATILHLEPQLAGHLPDHADLDGISILLVVDGKQGYAPLVLGYDSIGRDYTSTTRLATAFRGDGHADLAYAGTELDALKGVGFQAFQEVRIVVCNTTITLCKPLDTNIEILMSRDFVTHRSTLLPDGTCRNTPSLNTPSSLSCPGRSLPSRRASANPRQWGSAARYRDASATPRRDPQRPCLHILSDWHGNLLYLLSSWSEYVDMPCKDNTFPDSGKLSDGIICQNRIENTDSGKQCDAITCQNSTKNTDSGKLCGT